ncbi:MAG: PAS domain S-box protein [Verrucomicrobia bacterium]|nr:PAS domain S-box protein [Verrucomicrobiota bacterium]
MQASSGTEQALHEREITFATLAKVAPVGILRFDANGRCNYANDRWIEMTGVTIDQAIGDGWMQTVHPEDRGAIKSRWMTMCQENDSGLREEYRLCRTDGAVRWVLAEGAPLRSYAGQTIGFIRALTDVTEHRKLESELIAAREDLECRIRERTADLESEMRERQRLEKQVLETRDDEQRRFSNDLHDGLGQYLTGILFHVLALERDLASDKSPRAESASTIAALVNETIAQAHDLARGINPVPLGDDGLAYALQGLVNRLCRSHQAVDCRFEMNGPICCEDKAVATHLYRIAQEALTNAMKHSAATQVIVRLQKNRDDVSLIVRDNGRGFVSAAIKRGGRGITIMRHRAELIGATLNVCSKPGSGTTVECCLELPERPR